MSKKHTLDVITLRSLRKVSHISSRILKKSGTILDRVEHKTSRIIIRKTGAPTGEDSISLDEVMYHSFPHLTPIHPSLPNIGQKPSVTVFVPSLTPRGFYGGIATLLLASAALAKKLDYDYRVVQTSGFEKNNSVLKFLASNGVHIREERFSTVDVSYRSLDRFAYLPLHKDDVVVVSAWWDAHVASLLPLIKPFVYMIQDYEPIFYNNGDAQQFAEKTYFTNNFVPLCNTELLYSFFKKKGYKYIEKSAVWFEPAVAKKPAHDSVADKPVRKIFLYGRPSVDRNLFFSALLAIDRVLKDSRLAAYKWEVYSAGQSDVPSIRFQSGNTLKNLGKMELDDYYKFARTIDITVSPMLAPHPNYPTLELASLGSMVVSTKYETKQSLDMYSKNILMAEPTAEDMAKKIIAAALTPVSERRKNLAHTAIKSQWLDTLSAPLDEVVKKLAAK